MTAIKHECDRCEKTTEDSFDWEVVQFTCTAKLAKNATDVFDLCAYCARDFRLFMRGAEIPEVTS